MSILSDIAGDWEYIEGVETVTLVPQNPDGSEIGGVKALMKATGGNPLVRAAMGIDPDDVVWHLWEETLQGREPRNGWKIKDSRNGQWSISSVGYSRSGRYVCAARKFV